MGIAGSHPNIYHHSMNGSKKSRHILYRHGISNKYSLSAHLSYKPGADEKFFPPPILHTKFHELDFNSSVGNIFTTASMNKVLKQNFEPLKDDDKKRKCFSSEELPDISTCGRNLSFPVSRSSSYKKLSSPKDSFERGIDVKTLSASSVSSGVDSVLEEDSELDIEKIEKKAKWHDEKVSSKDKNEISELDNKQAAETDLHIPRSSLDSGASFDEEDAKNAIFDISKSFEIVFEEKERNDDSLLSKKSEEMYPRKISFPNRKKSRKFSLVKSFQKMSKRTASLPSANIASSSKSKFLFHDFHC
ncbi:unnamed protein product [Onchocerca flexuosa]|uniref:Protein TSSC4 n=1 Tax=Onchocerca flexuosa TaxID=387005 RepID=A0A183I180_9BILA|nr:unnamed protein product [Onchocerca flexuosa]